MYRGGMDLEGIVDSSYAFLTDMHGGDTLPRNNTWSNRNPVIYTQPRFNSVREIPEYAVPRTRQRDPFDGGNWVDSRSLKGTVRNLEREPSDSGDWEDSTNGTHRSLHQQRGRVGSEDWADPRSGRQQSRDAFESGGLVDTRNGTHQSFQQQKGRVDSEDWVDSRNLAYRSSQHPSRSFESGVWVDSRNGRHPSVQQQRSQLLDDGAWTAPPSRNQYYDDYPNEDTWEDRQTYDEDPYDYSSEEEVSQDPRKINGRRSRGSYLLQRTPDMVRERPYNPIPIAESSYLLNRTNHYLAAIQRMDTPVEPKPTPPPPPERTSSTLTSKSESIPAPPPPPPPPPTTLPNPEPKRIPPKPKETKIPPVLIPELEDIQNARRRLRPVPQKLDQQTGMQEFKDELSEKLYQVLETKKRWDNVLQPPVLEANQQESLTAMTEEKYKTVKTLHKNELKQKLTGLLQQGPQKPSFRGGQAMEEKRRNVAQQFLSHENKTYTVTEPDDALPRKPSQKAVISEVSNENRSSFQTAKR